MSLTPVTNGQRSDQLQLNQIIALLQAGTIGQLLRAPGSSGDAAWTALSAILGRGVHADRPAAAAGNAGTYYLETDTDGGTLFQSTGSGWVQVAPGVTAGGGGGGLIPLDGGGIVVPSGGLASVVLSAIPAGHGHLMLGWNAQSDYTDFFDEMCCRVNGDTSVDGSLNTFYMDVGEDYNFSGTLNPKGSSGSDTFSFLGTVTGSTQPTGYFGSGLATIPHYDATDRIKSFLTQSSRPDYISGGSVQYASAGYIGASYWLNMTAITSLTLLPYNGTKWLEGSTFRLWGVA